MDDQRQSTESSSPSNGTKASLLGLLIIGPILYVFLPDSRLSSLQIVIEIEILAAGIYLLLKKSMT
jgi:hypothetical protein